MAAAVKRGVDVRIRGPATSPQTKARRAHASHHRFVTLLKNCVKVTSTRDLLPQR